ncbi:MAG: UDP-N-acetylmuramate--L-alanine ligase [Chloroflexi bacterium]|nr:UDP-N-acetylmuramate--L-alanine ligase [Chloroflexota bacterium]
MSTTTRSRLSPVAGLPERIHLVGIGGIGISAIAQVLHGRGHIVTGSDQADSDLIAMLHGMGIKVAIGHRAENIGKAELVVISSAVPADNPEVRAAEERGIPVTKRRGLLARLIDGYHAIAIAGTHGKTTSAAMLAATLARLDADPTFIVGGVISELGTNARAGAGKVFVLEADEYDGAFQDLEPRTAIVTNIEMDHPDVYAAIEDVAEAFDGFMRHTRADGKLIVCADSPQITKLLHERQYPAQVLTYGTVPWADYHVADITSEADGHITWKILKSGADWLSPRLQLAGAHNALNATAVLMALEHAGVALPDAVRALGEFSGVRRRFEIKGEAGGVTIIDDYGHHPTQIAATLQAARTRYQDRRVWAIFQPHTYSRTRALWDDFTRCFGAADEVVVMDIYRARTREVDALAASDLAAAIEHSQVHYLPDRAAVVAHLAEALRAGDVLITLGAGDDYLVGEEILSVLRERG